MRSFLEELKEKAKTIFESKIQKMITFFFEKWFFYLDGIVLFVHCERMKIKREIKSGLCDESLSLPLLQKINIFCL